MSDMQNSTTKKTKVICIGGKAQHGKDTTGAFLYDALNTWGTATRIAHYGDLVKYICKTFFDWDGVKDDCGRSLLQHVGTDVIRAKDPNYWVNFIIDMLGFFDGYWDYVIIPDCRFPNEIECLQDAGLDTTYIRVERAGFVSPLTEEQQKHPSETALDDYPADYIIFNSGTLEDLKDSVATVVEHIR